MQRKPLIRIKREARPVPALCLAVLALLAGCATTQTPHRPADAATAFCLGQIERIDRAVASARVGDGGAQRISGFPWLRVTRPLASFRDEVRDDARYQAWLEHLEATAATGRGYELANLPGARRAEREAAWSRHAPDHGLPTELDAGLSICRSRLSRTFAEAPEHRQRLRQAASAEDEYVTWQRVLGFYPIARRVVRPRIEAYQARRAAVFDAPAQNPEHRYAGPSRPGSAAGSMDRDALGIPRPGSAEAARLLEAHAPVWAVETVSPADRPGAIILTAAGRPVAATRSPAEYRHLSWTRFRGDVLLQLNYLVWFPARPPEGFIDLYAGHLDGVLWRVTLDPDGEPLAYDSIHSCGCYYTLFPTRGWGVTEVPADAEPVASPRRAPRTEPDKRLMVRLESGTHYLAGLETVNQRPTGMALAPLPYDTLRSRPRPGGGAHSTFAPDGLIPSSARLERFVLWPFGVPSAGAMRQWGTHAIAFVGRRHFDDPFLLDELLVAEPGT